MTQDSEKKEMLTIKLSFKRPVKIDRDLWQAIATASDKEFDNQYEFQANRITKVWAKVRKNVKNGKLIVYGQSSYESQFQGDRNIEHYSGYILENDSKLEETVLLVGDELCQAVGKEFWTIGMDLKNDLPAEDIDNPIQIR